MADKVCGNCSKRLEDTENTLTCDFCAKDFHPKSCDLPNPKFKALLSFREMVTWMCPTCSKMKPLEKLNVLFESQKALEKKVDSLVKDVQELKEKNAPTTAPDVIREIEERDYKKKNLILTGLKPELDIKNQISAFVSDNLDMETKSDDIEKSWIIKPKSNPANPPLIAIRLKSKRIRDAILANSKKLRKSDNPELRKVFIIPDYSKDQMKKIFTLRQEMITRRANGEHLILRNFRLIVRSQQGDTVAHKEK